MIRHTELAWGMSAIIFIHGLGGSRQVFIEAFESGRFERYNLFAPDLPGHGNSPGGIEYSVTAMLQCIEAIITHFNIPHCILVGHGFGGDLACWIAHRTLGQKIVRGVISIEGTYSENALTYADMAIASADDPAKTYLKWFQTTFMENTILVPHIGKDPAYRRFYESLQMCRPYAFLALARDIRDKLYTDSKKTLIQAAEAFEQLNIPKCYCIAENGLNTQALPELELREIPHLQFKGAGHWLMMDQPIPFYTFLENFTLQHMPPPTTRERLKAHFYLRFQAWLNTLPQEPEKIIEKIHFFIRTRIQRKL